MWCINGKSTFINSPRSQPSNPRDCVNLGSWIFDNFILADKLFAKAFMKKLYTTCLLVGNGLCDKLVPSFFCCWFKFI